MKAHFKWLFTRWYLYVLTFVLFFYEYEPSTNFMFEFFLGEILASFVWSVLIISIIRFIYLKVRKT